MKIPANGPIHVEAKPMSAVRHPKMPANVTKALVLGTL